MGGIESDYPYYWEAVIISRDNRGTLVEWHDGERERLKGYLDIPLRFLANGTNVGVRVKLGQQGKVTELWHEVKILNPEATKEFWRKTNEQTNQTGQQAEQP